MKNYSNKPPESPKPNRAPGVQKPAAPDGRDDQAAGFEKAGPAGKSDASERSRETACLIAAVNQLPDVREARVQAIKQQVDAGVYRVDARKIAEKMISEACNEN